MSYTPRTLFAWHYAEVRRQNRALAHTALAIRAAQHADGTAFDKLMTSLLSKE